jgi:hypothetical protein
LLKLYRLSLSLAFMTNFTFSCAGTGGHLHNLGVVLRKTPLVSTAIPAEMPAAAARHLRARLLALCEEKGMHACGLLAYYSGQSTQSLARENSVVRFVGTATQYDAAVLNPASLLTSHLLVQTSCVPCARRTRRVPRRPAYASS